MVTVWIYRPIKIGKWSLSVPVRRKVPSTWQELSQEKALQFVSCLMIHKLPFGETIPYEMRFEILNAWLRISSHEFYRFTDLQIAILLEKIDPIFEEAKTIPKFKNGKYRLPAELLEGETVEAFAIAYEEHYANIIEGMEVEKNLNWLCAYLLREKGKSVDTTIAKKRLPEVVQMLPAQRFYIYWWYAITREELIARYPGAFGKNGVTKGKKGADFTSHHRWLGCIHQVATDGPFGTEKELKQTEVHEFLHYLDFNDGKAREMEWNMKKNS